MIAEARRPALIRSFARANFLLADVDPGFEAGQRGRRAAVVVSRDDMKLMSRRVIVCRTTRSVQPWPTKVFPPAGLGTEGAISVDQVGGIESDARIVHAMGFVPDNILAEVRSKLAPLPGIRVI